MNITLEQWIGSQLAVRVMVKISEHFNKRDVLTKEEFFKLHKSILRDIKRDFKG